MSDLRTCAHAAAILLALACSAGASAQASGTRRAPPPVCAPSWWDHASIVAALRVELRELAIEVGDEGAPIVFEPVDCLTPDGPLRVRISETDPLSARVVDVEDVEPHLRPRTLALAAASLLREEGMRALARSRTEPDPIVAPPPETPARRIVSLSIAAELAALSTRNVLSGLRTALTVRPWPELFFEASVAARATRVGDPLGDIEAVWIEGAVGGGARIDADPIAIDLRAAFGFGWAGARGLPVIADRGASIDGPILTVELGAALSIRVAADVAIDVGASALVIPLGLDVYADARRKLALSDLAFLGRAGVSFDL